MVYSLAGVFALALAFVFSMLGLGGALLYVPVFHWLGFDFKSVAIPTGLLLNVVTALSASTSYLRNRMVDIPGSLALIVTSTLTAPVGAYTCQFVNSRLLIGLFAGGMVVAAVRMLAQRDHREEAGSLRPLGQRAIVVGSAGLGIGFVAGLLGIGGGFLIVPMLLALGYPTKTAAATSAFAVIFSSLSGFTSHWAQGHFDPSLLFWTVPAVLIGSQVGAVVMREKMKAAWIWRLFGVILLVVAARLGWELV